ncbi:MULTISPECIES: glycosyl hydrolase family 18 protein [unclassified Streptomyces]|uniref:glycosyl hydrolase family 18 protein n=1 Tax=unclassified Streptomyces TaxID=2593676 RepID=UPI002252FE69|nr:MULTISPECIES: glycosyl hydrolase family 18 protein [unclassified Streptomyces]MCX4553445.1 glycosyl hydrolase family 18 protein [Streptomyces sp. NBC_01500]WSC18405.1 glycosyl hydrolase family 18 protein [Streptomyces sp. NBC_01766]WSV52446.1 glycosyl hydrolase family 18 protein [Streptomyces sp. NBC_01014]
MRLRRLSTTLSLAVAVALAGPLATAASAQAAADHRVVVYYQTQFDNGSYVSPKELTDHDTGVTDVIVGAVHLNGDGSVTLNDNSPDDAKFDQMWSDLAAVQSKGVHVLGMVGGAAVGSFQRLDSDFDTYYPKLKNVVSTHHLDGLDLDVEEGMSLVGVERVIDQLHSDFGDGFLVTLAPVATALNGGGNLSGFGYDALYRDKGSSISWFNAQFYCGWGSLDSPAGYEGIVGHGVVPASKVVAGTLTNPANCGSGYVPMDTLTSTVSQLSKEYGDFGGVAGWEYFNSDPGGTAAPWEWAANMSSAMSG